MADFDFNESRRARVDVARGAFADDYIPLDVYTPPEATGGGAETSFIDPPEDVWEAQNETPSWLPVASHQVFLKKILLMHNIQRLS